MLTLTCALVCGFAALAGGFIDAISGGGGLLTIPALLLSGIPPHVALGTSKIATFAGTTVSLINFSRHHLVQWHMAAWGIPFSLLGSWIGSLLALYLDSAVLGKVMIIMLPVAMILTLLPQKRRQDENPEAGKIRFWILLPIVCLTIGCYDGFFGPGTGSMLILLLHWFMRQNMLQASATAKAFNLASNISAALSFMWHGVIFWSLALIMGAAFILGNWLGSSFAIHAGSGAVRKFLLVSLILLLTSLVWQYFIEPAMG